MMQENFVLDTTHKRVIRGVHVNMSFFFVGGNVYRAQPG